MKKQNGIEDLNLSNVVSPIKPVIGLAYCYDCRLSNGFVAKDVGAHTAELKKCECCEKRKLILGERHWKK
jgi:hypothetical protein